MKSKHDAISADVSKLIIDFHILNKKSLQMSTFDVLSYNLQFDVL